MKAAGSRQRAEGSRQQEQLFNHPNMSSTPFALFDSNSTLSALIARVGSCPLARSSATHSHTQLPTELHHVSLLSRPRPLSSRRYCLIVVSSLLSASR